MEPAGGIAPFAGTVTGNVGGTIPDRRARLAVTPVVTHTEAPRAAQGRGV